MQSSQGVIANSINKTRRRNRRNRRRRGAPIRAQLRSIDKFIGRQQNAIEFKYVDTTVSDTAVSWNGVYGVLNNPSQDITDQARIGDSLFNKYLEIRYRVFNNGSDGAGLRLIILKDHSDVITAVNQVLGATGTNLALTSNYIWDNRKNFKVLVDEIIQCDGTRQSNTMGYIKRKLNFRTQFSAASTTIETNSLKMIHINNTNPTASTFMEFYASVRLVFSDE